LKVDFDEKNSGKPLKNVLNVLDATTAEKMLRSWLDENVKNVQGVYRYRRDGSLEEMDLSYLGVHFTHFSSNSKPLRSEEEKSSKPLSTFYNGLSNVLEDKTEMKGSGEKKNAKPLKAFYNGLPNVSDIKAIGEYSRNPIYYIQSLISCCPQERSRDWVGIEYSREYSRWYVVVSTIFFHNYTTIYFSTFLLYSERVPNPSSLTERKSECLRNIVDENRLLYSTAATIFLPQSELSGRKNGKNRMPGLSVTTTEEKFKSWLEEITETRTSVRAYRYVSDGGLEEIDPTSILPSEFQYFSLHSKPTISGEENSDKIGFRVYPGFSNFFSIYSKA